MRRHRSRGTTKRVRIATTGVAALSLALGLLTAAPATTAAPNESPSFPEVTTAPPEAKLPPAGDNGLRTYSVTADAAQLKQIFELGIDRHETEVRKAAEGKANLEVVLDQGQAAKLRAAGIALDVKAEAAQDRSLAPAAAGVFRKYSGEGGLGAEMVQLAKDHPDIAKTVSIGKTVLGQDILAVKVTKNVRTSPDGSKPGVVYMSNQHAREWITPEMTRRLMHKYVEGYGTDDVATKLVSDNELWFVLSANPDGLDWTFQPGQRLWRKNLRDNNGDGVITAGDGVDLNRNFDYKWGYDNEGSSPDPANETYRGTGPSSEPETKAMQNFAKRVKAEFVVNYHSAAQLLLYGVGWQVETPTPDDQIMVALAGDDAHPAVPDFDPDLSAELYTTNGDTDGQMNEAYKTLSFTPEMSTCVTAANYLPDDPYTPANCGSIFSFPNDETLVAMEFAKNIPFALSIAKSAADPDDPVSAVGWKAPDLVADKFEHSYAEDHDDQTVAVIAKRSLSDRKLNYRVNGGKTKTAGVKEWKGGERYGGEGTRYLAEYRGDVKNVRTGDKVEVWFTGDKPGTGKVESEHFTFTVESGIQEKTETLVVANEDYKGVNPTYPAGTVGPKYAQQYVDALQANGIRAAVWDVDKLGVPHPLGVLSHFKGVFWYLGDNRLTQNPSDEYTDVFGQPVADAQVADSVQWLTMAVRDFINEGGKVAHLGETAGYFGPLRGAAGGGIYYGLNGAPDKPCVITADPAGDCLIVSDDFTQYYLGAYDRSATNGATGFTGTGAPLIGLDKALPGTASNPLNEAGGYLPTGAVLPDHPLFDSRPAATYQGNTSGPFSPAEGKWYINGLHTDNAYKRLMRTIDLSTVSAADAAKLTAQMSYNAEDGWDHVIVEAHTVGADDWTTLPDLNGRTTTTPSTQCEAGDYVNGHPQLRHYLTVATPTCKNTGTTGAWNAFTGDSGGWQPVAFDLSAYAGKKVEVSIAYVSDSSANGTGVFIDDTKVVTNAGVVDAEGFETGLGPWVLAGPPPGDQSIKGYDRSEAVFGTAVVVTDDTMLFGFGLEQLANPADRKAVVDRILRELYK
ncbi:M14 family zinc carboxypeptidase [Embleya sp. NBC_00896]|uniref:M14 family metallopeptidase n=1 Tax=Embleya sp. NBC_00896 TaxID=2975961 RepID=UPI003869989D|nr:M14 family zinc carboxypeptidase [Embleya sp. NBC_00896]